MKCHSFYVISVKIGTYDLVYQFASCNTPKLYYPYLAQRDGIRHYLLFHLGDVKIYLPAQVSLCAHIFTCVIVAHVISCCGSNMPTTLHFFRVSVERCFPFSNFVEFRLMIDYFDLNKDTQNNFMLLSNTRQQKKLFIQHLNGTMGRFGWRQHWQINTIILIKASESRKAVVGGGGQGPSYCF